MSQNPFGDLNESVKDRRQRERTLRKRKWLAFRDAVLAVLVIGLGAGVGGGVGAWIFGTGSGTFLEHFLGGLGGATFGGLLFFVVVLGVLVRLAVVSDLIGGGADVGGATPLTIATLLGACLGGSIGGMTGSYGDEEKATLACAAAGAGLGVVFYVLLRRASKGRSKVAPVTTEPVTNADGVDQGSVGEAPR